MGGYRVYGSGFRVLGSKVLGVWGGSEGLMLRVGASSSGSGFWDGFILF